MAVRTKFWRRAILIGCHEDGNSEPRLVGRRNFGDGLQRLATAKMEKDGSEERGLEEIIQAVCPPLPGYSRPRETLFFTLYCCSDFLLFMKVYQFSTTEAQNCKATKYSRYEIFKRTYLQNTIYSNLRSCYFS